MKFDYFPNRKSPMSLAYQIDVAEQQILNRQGKIHIHARQLISQIRQRLIAPSSFFVAGSFGFALGELTKSQRSESRGAAVQPAALAVSPLKVALNLLTSARTLYTALPLAWISKSFSGARRPVKQRPSSQKPTLPKRGRGLGRRDTSENAVL